MYNVSKTVVDDLIPCQKPWFTDKANKECKFCWATAVWSCLLLLGNSRKKFLTTMYKPFLPSLCTISRVKVQNSRFEPILPLMTRLKSHPVLCLVRHTSPKIVIRLIALLLVSVVRPHCSGRGRKTDFGSQWEFQRQMIYWVVGFNKIQKWKKSTGGPSLLILGF